MTDRDAIEARLCKLRAAQEAAPGWGAAVGARSEEIKGLESQLRRLDLPSPLSPVTETLDRVAEAIRLRSIERGYPVHPVMVRHLAAAAIEAFWFAQCSKQPTIDELGGLIEHGLSYGIASKDARLAARIVMAALADTSIDAPSQTPAASPILKRLCEPEAGHTIHDVVANYRAIRRDALSISSTDRPDPTFNVGAYIDDNTDDGR